MKKAMTPTREDLIDLRHNEGMTREEIAKHYGVPVAKVRRWIKTLDVPRPERKVQPKMRVASEDQMLAAVGSPMSSLETALMNLEGRVIEKLGVGYYLDGRPASVDQILAAAELVI